MKNQLGYTLKELLVVIVFVAVALSIVVAGIAAFIWLLTKFL